MFKPVESFENLPTAPRVKIKPLKDVSPIRTSDVEIPYKLTDKVKMADLDSVLLLKSGSNPRPKQVRELGINSRNHVVNSHPGPPPPLKNKKTISTSPTKSKILEARQIIGLKGMSAKVSKKYL